MLKPLTVWITEYSGNFKEMGIPDHLTCLGKKVMTNLDSILKSRDIILPTSTTLRDLESGRLWMSGKGPWERRAVGLRGGDGVCRGDWVGDVMGLNRVPPEV